MFVVSGVGFVVVVGLYLVVVLDSHPVLVVVVLIVSGDNHLGLVVPGSHPDFEVVVLFVSEGLGKVWLVCW